MGRITTIYGEINFCDFCGNELRPEWDYTISISNELSIGIFQCDNCKSFDTVITRLEVYMCDAERMREINIVDLCPNCLKSAFDNLDISIFGEDKNNE